MPAKEKQVVSKLAPKRRGHGALAAKAPATPNDRATLSAKALHLPSSPIHTPTPALTIAKTVMMTRCHFMDPRSRITSHSFF
jgi:hypothetical protein